MQADNYKASNFIHRSLLIGLGLFVLLALFYWQERVFFLDASYQVFSLLEQGDLPIQHQRYGGAVVLFLPYLLAQLEAPLVVVLASYSLSFALYPLLFFLLLQFGRLKHFAWAIGCLFLFVTAHTFFWIQNELIISTVLALVAVGITTIQQWAFGWRVLLLLPLSWLTIYTHPLGIAPLLASWLFFLVREVRSQSPNKKQSYFILAVMVVAFLLFIGRQFLFNQSNYDQAAMGMAENMLANLPGLFGHPAMDRFMRYSLSTQLPLTIALVLILQQYIRRKEWWRLTAVVLPFFIWLCLIVCAWPWAPDRFYIESYYYVFGSILALPFVFDVLPQLSSKWIKRLFFGFVLFRLVSILLVSPTYRARLSYLEEKVSLLQDQEQQRLLIQKDSLDMELLKMEWGLSFETLLLSSYLDPQRARTIMAIEGEPPAYCDDPDLAAVPTVFGPLGYRRLQDQAYIQLTDTSAVSDIGLRW